jgi:hypothetical protein
MMRLSVAIAVVFSLAIGVGAYAYLDSRNEQLTVATGP